MEHNKPQTKLHFKCPSCEATLRPVDSMSCATQVVRRKCSKCGERWQLKVTPNVRQHMRFDVGEFVKVQ